MATPENYRELSDQAPADDHLTHYDRAHGLTYLRLLDADAEGADWREAASVILKIDAASEPNRAKAAWDSHLARAKWMMDRGYRQLLGHDTCP